jgi:HD-like signal output (HDOD) protein
VSIDSARVLVAEVGQLPVIPDQADRLLRLAASGDTDLSELLAIVESDSVMTAMVLRLVNSAAFGLARRITSVGQAVVLLGMTHVRSLAMAASMASLFSGRGASAKTAWRHGFAVGCGARTLASHVGLRGREEEAFTAGLLHDIGELVIESCMTGATREISRIAELDQVPRLAAERIKLGADHAEIGAALAEHWALPTQITDAISMHHNPAFGFEVDPSAGQQEVSTIARLVAASEAVLKAHVDQGYIMTTADPVALIGDLGASDPEALVEKTRDEIIRHLLAADLTQGMRR